MELKKQKLIPSISDYPFTTFKTAFGLCKISWGQSGITALKLLEEGKCLEQPQEKIPNAIQNAIQAIQNHLSGKLQDLSAFTIDFSGISSFFIKIYKVAQKIPYGTTVTYCDLAKKAGSPKAGRAVGQAMARNPYLLFIPCHRIVGVSKKLGGFSAPGGINTKRELLQLEGATIA